MGTGSDGFLAELSACRIVALDTNACIYHLQTQQVMAPLLAPLMRRATEGRLRILLSAVVQLELLVQPYERGDPHLMRRVVHFSERHPAIQLCPVTVDVVHVAAQIRAALRMKLADAIVAGSAAVFGADAIVGNDAGFRRIGESRAGGLSLLSQWQRVRVPRYLHLAEYID